MINPIKADRLGTLVSQKMSVPIYAFLAPFEKINFNTINSANNADRRINMKKVGIVMGSDSDLPIIRKATDVLDKLDIPYEVHVYSAHRTPDEAGEFAANAKKNGFGVLIAAAGMAAHLAGAVAARTTLPVIGIPCKSTNLDGIDALLATVQMPTGVPVATVAINGGANAALLSAQILALSDDELAAKLENITISDVMDRTYKV